MPNSAATPAPPRVLKRTAVPTLSFLDSADVGHHVALVIAGLIRENNAAGMPTVLGLPTGSSPTGVYRALIQLHQEEGLDFSRVITFNLDEYWPMPADSIHSYQRFMRETFFEHVNIPEENIHIPRGDLPAESVEEFCEEYERQIERAGGIDLMLLGLGRNGHIGFNEPGSDKNTRTRLVTLDPVTRQDAAGDFFGEENVPMQALTMGLGTILSARKIIVMVLGEHKADTVRKAVEEDPTRSVPASFLQNHRNAIIAVDKAAGAKLTAIATPWLISEIRWNDKTEKQAVIWLARQSGKAVLKLEARDFHSNHLHQLVRERGPVQAIRQRVFEDLHSGICPQPGGGEPRRVLVFSPHPDDDVISMGGTLITLAQQQHDVHVAYMTSGNIAVFDHDALRHINYVEELQTTFGLNSEAEQKVYESLRRDIAGKGPGDPDSQNVLDVKSLIRKTEAVAAANTAGVPSQKCHFLDLPFYRTGEIAKKPIGEEDVAIVAALLRELSPDQVYVAGDLTDPHGTQRLCAEAIFRALHLIEPDGLVPEVWLYRGAWQEYEPDEIERAVP
jgi:glucosamine-6-phosphate deaminase